MLYFRLNRDKYTYNMLSEIQDPFFKTLKDEFGLSGFTYGASLYDVLGVPKDAFGIDEANAYLDDAIRFVLPKYAKLPIKGLDNKSLNDLGINIEFCKRISNEESISLICENTPNYITEEVLWKNMPEDKKINTFLKLLEKIGTKDNELIIVDPYIFSSTEDDYCNILASVLSKSGAKTIIIVTVKDDKKHYCDKSYNKISDKSGKTLVVINSDDFHDRFWIANRKKGFYTGTSFNGIGKRISLINMLSAEDVTEIVDELLKQSLIS